MAEIKCPMCGKPNPEDLNACQFCEARLKPVTDELSRSQPPIHVGDEPTKKDTAELEPVLPKWLREVRQQGRDSAEEDAQGAEEQARDAEDLEAEKPQTDLLAGLQSQPEEDEQIPEWLAGLRSGKISDVLDDAPLAEGSLPEKREEGQSEGSEKDSAGNLPGWVSDLDESPKGTDEEEKLGDWLADEVSKGKSAEPVDELSSKTPLDFDSLSDPQGDSFSQTEQSEETIQIDSDIPAWLKVDEAKSSDDENGVDTKPLKKLALDPTPEVDSVEPAAANLESEMPGWLRKMGDEDTETSSTIEPDATEKDELPDTPGWLDEKAPVDLSSESVVEDGAIESTTKSELPEWLGKMESGGDEPEQQAEEPPATPVEDLISAPGPQAIQPDEPESTSTPTGVAPFTVEDLQTDGQAINGAALSEKEETTLSGEDVDAIFSMEMPTWLSEVETSEPGAKAPVSSSPAPETSDLRPAELPSWVQAMRPVEAFISGGDRDESGQPAEEKGPLAGLRGVLPLVPGVGPSSTPKTYSIKLQASEEQLTSAEMLEQMLDGEVHPKPMVTRPGMLSQRFLRMAIFGLLLLIVGGSLIAGTQINQIPLSAPAGTGQALSIVRDELLPDAPVLMIFDYEAALAPEMETVAAPLVDYMILLKHPRLSLLASKPTGAGLSERFMRITQSGQAFLNLGYLPGDAAGALAFVDDPVSAKPMLVNGQSVWESPTLQGVERISDFAAILLITDAPETARTWIEQTQNNRGATRLVIIASAQAGPLLRPYMESGQIDGMVTGLEGGGPIELVNSGRPGKARRYWDAFGFGLLATIFMIFFGSLWSLFLAWRARREKPGNG